MKNYSADKIKNIAFLGHGNSGKTTLASAILYHSKAAERIGNTSEGTSVFDFDAEEIMGRFVRGDESRTAEGNGLGLDIAKSYTEICNGAFEIEVDGDMIKAILKFRIYS